MYKVPHLFLISFSHVLIFFLDKNFEVSIVFLLNTIANLGMFD